MSSPKLTPFSYAVLTLVGREGAGPHDLVRYMRAGARLYWAAAPSQYYAEPKRLAKLGLLRARSEPGQTRDRTHYELTDAGRAALAEWVKTPAPFPRIQHEPAVRVLAADLTDPADVLEGLDALRAELDDLDRWLDASEERAASLPHRERALRANHRLSRRIVQAHREWLDEVEGELGAAPQAPGRTSPGS
jgi:PadR family transcriptional regulator, regulatory protein AphA